METESNLKSNDVFSDKHHEVMTFEKPARYKELEIKGSSVMEDSTKGKYQQNSHLHHQQHIIQQQQLMTPQEQTPVTIKVEQQSLSINDQTTNAINQQNFDGRVFTTTPHQSYYTNQTQIVQTSNKDTSSVLTPHSIQASQPSQPTYTNQFQSFRQSFDLY